MTFDHGGDGEPRGNAQPGLHHHPRVVHPPLNGDLWNISTMSIERWDRGYAIPRHSVSPTECRDYLAERCRGALERVGACQNDVDVRRRNLAITPVLTLITGRRGGRGARRCGRCGQSGARRPG